jgi:hypothetical protein
MSYLKCRCGYDYGEWTWGMDYHGPLSCAAYIEDRKHDKAIRRVLEEMMEEDDLGVTQEEHDRLERSVASVNDRMEGLLHFSQRGEAGRAGRKNTNEGRRGINYDT